MPKQYHEQFEIRDSDLQRLFKNNLKIKKCPYKLILKVSGSDPIAGNGEE